MGKKDEKKQEESVPETRTEMTASVSKTRKVHCEACSKNYDLAEGQTPVCCEKPNIQNL